MRRSVQTRFNKVQPVPASLRADPRVDAPVGVTDVNLGQLFQHYYFDSYGPGAPPIDPSRFEYLQLVAPQPDFRFLSHVSDASVVKRRALSTEIGQAFCRWMLHEHFSIRYFAHMSDVLGKPTHAAFEGTRVERTDAGDVPDYFCAWSVDRPYLAEAKGRFSPVSFGTLEFQRWRDQFQRVRVLDRGRRPIQIKGYIVGTRFTTEAQRSSMQTTVFTEDPESPGELMHEGGGRALGRVVAAMHYARVFRKLDLRIFAASLENGFAVAPELTFQVPIWTCGVEPFLGVEFVGGFYATEHGSLPNWSGGHWTVPAALGRGHFVFVGLRRDIATDVARAARGQWAALDTLGDVRPEGVWSSEFSWLHDGTVLAPLESFRPTGVQVL